MTCNKEILISGFRKQKDMLESLIEDLEPKEILEDNDVAYCEAVLKRVENIVHELKRTRFDHGKYQNFSIYRIWPDL